MFRITNVPGAVVAIVLVAVIAACASTTDATEPPLVTGEPPTKRLPIIIDTDLDHSDIAAVMILVRDPAVDVRAITIAGTGLVHCQAGRLVLRYLLDELGSPDIPFGCGRENGGPDARPFPETRRDVVTDSAGLARTTFTFASSGQWYVRSQAGPTPYNANSVPTPVERYSVG